MLFLSQRPLSASDRDSDLFVDRERELGAVHRALGLDFNALVLGERGSGRSSLLRQVFRSAGVGAVVIDAQPFGHAQDLVLGIAATLGGDERPDYVVGERTVPSSLTGFNNPFEPVKRLVETPILHDGHLLQLRAAAEEWAATEPPTERVVVLLDGISPEPAKALFGRYRDTLWDMPITWVVTGELQHRGAYLAPPADAFFDAVVTLPPLSVHASAELLRRRVAAAGDAPDARRLDTVIDALIEGLSVRSPRNVLAAARSALLDEESPLGAVQRRARRNEQVAALGAREARAFTELEALGPKSASDHELLQRLGLTRPRLVEVLNRLEHEGLVTSWREGRRKLFGVAALQESS